MNNNLKVYTEEEKNKYLAKLSKNADKRRKIRIFFDIVKNSFTYLCSIFSIVVLVGVIIYCFSTGSKSFNWDFITGSNYNTQENLNANPENKNGIEVNQNSNFSYTPSEGEYFSSRWGIAFTDKETNGVGEVIFTHIDKNSTIFQLGILDDNNNFTVTKVTEGSSLLKAIGYNDNGGRERLNYNKKASEMAKGFDRLKSLSYITLIFRSNGIKGPLISTFYFIIIALLVSLPLGVGGAIYLAYYAKNNFLTRSIRTIIDMIAGIPSIIFGLTGAIIFIPIFGGVGNILSGGFTLACMVLPTIIKNTEESIKVIPRSLKDASLALGASSTQTVFKIILPNCLPGILTGSLLALGRIIGESAALIFATGSLITDTPSLGQPAASLAVYIWSIMQGENPNYQAAAATAILILIVVLVLNILVKIVAYKLDKFTPKKPFEFMTYINKIKSFFVKKEKVCQIEKK